MAKKIEDLGLSDIVGIAHLQNQKAISAARCAIDMFNRGGIVNARHFNHVIVEQKKMLHVLEIMANKVTNDGKEAT